MAHMLLLVVACGGRPNRLVRHITLNPKPSGSYKAYYNSNMDTLDALAQPAPDRRQQAFTPEAQHIAYIYIYMYMYMYMCIYIYIYILYIVCMYMIISNR